MPSLRLASVALVGVAAVALLSGCGNSPARRPRVCELKAQEAIARDLGVQSGTVGYRAALGSNGMPQCSFKAREGRRGVGVTVNVDDGSQPYFRLLRTVDEATQIFGAPPPDFHPPQRVSGLGPFASWFPNNHWLMATNDKVLVTVTVVWARASRGQEVGLAKAAIVPYVPRLKGHRNTKDFP